MATHAHTNSHRDPRQTRLHIPMVGLCVCLLLGAFMPLTTLATEPDGEFECGCVFDPEHPPPVEEALGEYRVLTILANFASDPAETVDVYRWHEYPVEVVTPQDAYDFIYDDRYPEPWSDETINDWLREVSYDHMRISGTVVGYYTLDLDIDPTPPSLEEYYQCTDGVDFLEACDPDLAAPCPSGQTCKQRWECTDDADFFGPCDPDAVEPCAPGQTCRQQGIFQLLARMALADAADEGLSVSWVNNVFVSTDFDRLVIVSPLRMGRSGASTNTVCLNGSLNFRTYLHELGHTFGLSHACGWNCGFQVFQPTCEVRTYADYCDPMGLGEAHFNGRHKIALGWLDNATHVSYVTAPGTYTLAALEITDGIRVLKIPRGPTGAGGAFYVDLHRPIGADLRAAEYMDGSPFNNCFDGVQVYWDAQTPWSATFLLDMTPESRPYPDGDFWDAVLLPRMSFFDDATGVTVELLSLGEETAEVRVAPPIIVDFFPHGTQREIEFGGEVVVDVDPDDTYDYAYVWLRYTDANNGDRFTITDKGASTVVALQYIVDGQVTDATTATINTAPPLTLSFGAYGCYLKVWYDGDEKLSYTLSPNNYGSVALGGPNAAFDNLKIGVYDSDGDLDDVDDVILVNETFGSEDKTGVYDNAGNLIDDGNYIYEYDAWNRLVRVRAKEDDYTVQTAEFYGKGSRRAKKYVADGYDIGKTEVYLYDGQKMIETRDGSGNMVQQFIHGTQYIDELVMTRTDDKGDLYVHQDANWNVIGLTDLGGNVVERYTYTPYGIMTANQSTGYGDYDGDGDVDSTDRAAGEVGGACRGSGPSGACRVLDLDFDDDVDDDDLDLFDDLPDGLARHPGRMASGVGQPFGHQGLLFEPEIGSYQNRHRQYSVASTRFLQRDPLGYGDGLHLYTYARSNPVAVLDPTGMYGWLWDSHILILAASLGGGGIMEEINAWKCHCYGINCMDDCYNCGLCYDILTAYNNETALAAVYYSRLEYGQPLNEVHLVGHGCGLGSYE